MSAVEPLVLPSHLHISYSDATAEALLAAPDTLAVIGFGDGAPTHDDPRYLRIALQPHGAAPLEHWRAHGPVARGRDAGVAWAEDGALQFGAIELDEDEGDIEAAASAAYARLGAFTQARGYPHLLRVWNYLDGITHGDGDAERYRIFCVGRARGLGEFDPQALPAATAIGHSTAAGAQRLQVYWLAARTPGTPLENPRQISAYRYPRQYGPQPPSFARAMLPPGTVMPLLISGTAAIVGHESRHADDIGAQLDETLANLDSLIAAAHARRPELPARMGAGTQLKAYVRDRADLDIVSALLRERVDPGVRFVVLHAAICRRELRVEIDGVHDAAG
ncbi:chorismate lyase/3-hydroxybenzoate synthase [Lysobacter niabensis]|uniref:Chorismate lyase/3-hydroxybenzoate synthase n=1 Tax=Agrilutibacter niabensis TaxID=380628 RepID=A0ABU1VRB7_9GAMM|nr:pteridine-dependent deoxygenase [Lysobacter niabensis]MDR7100021.1 chorismate lyase/3-hydroxybenzoate synthase [Lysobacter niabensis]